MSQNFTTFTNITSPQDVINPLDFAVKFYPYFVATFGAILAVYGVWDRWFPKAIPDRSDAYIDYVSHRRFENHHYKFQWGRYFKKVNLPKYPRHSIIEVISYKPHPSQIKEIPDQNYKVNEESDYCQITLCDIPFFRKMETEFVHVLVSTPTDEQSFKDKISITKTHKKITIINENYDAIHNYPIEIDDEIALQNMITLLSLPDPEVSRPKPEDSNQNATISVTIPGKGMNGNIPGKLIIPLI